MIELVKYIVTELVTNKEAVTVELNGDVINVSVAKEDMGKVIGKQGRTAKAIRSIVKAASAGGNVKYTVEIMG